MRVRFRYRYFVYIPTMLILLVLAIRKHWPEKVPEEPGPITSSEALAESSTFYGRTIRPLFMGQCVRCHGSRKQYGELRVDTVAALRRGGKSGPAIVPGNSSRSLLVKQLKSEQMPEGGPPLSAEDIAHICRWIDQGAVGPKDEQPVEQPIDHWAFQPLRQPAVPRVQELAWAKNPIDAFLAAARAKSALPASPPVAKGLLLRRVFLDLTGLPPSREDYHQFLQDPSPAAYQAYVDRLLASPQYGERWARHWMDVWRYSSHDARTQKPELTYGNPHLWRWRDWLIQSIHQDKGYHHMVVEMLANDELVTANKDELAATGFLVRNYNGLDRNLWLSVTVDHTCKAFLGLSMGCARCHDHKFDPISQKDYYQMRAFFERHQIKTDDEARLAHAINVAGFPETFLLGGGDPKKPRGDPLEPQIPEFCGKLAGEGHIKKPRLVLAKWLISDENPLVARVAVNHIWLRHFGRGLVDTPAEFGTRGKSPSHPELLDWLASQFRHHDWSMKWLHRLIVTSQAYQQSASNLGMETSLQADRDNVLLWRFPARRMEAEVVRDAVLFLAGKLEDTIGGPDVDHLAAETSKRRSLYLRTSRVDRVPFLDIFDGARVEECYRRTETIIPQQALALLNSEMVWGCAESLASRLPHDSAFLDDAFLLILGRPATGQEKTECRQFMVEQEQLLREAGAENPGNGARSYLVHALFNHNDFVSIR